MTTERRGAGGIPAESCDGHRVEIWRFSLDVADAKLRQFKALLSEDEIARAERFVQKAHGDNFVVARGRLREILCQYTGGEATAFKFEISETGKPSLTTPGEVETPVHYNITHSGGAAAIALCKSAQVGIDIERVRPVHEGLAQLYFAASEVAALDALSEPERLDAFFRCWTRKEAFVKATGEGIRRGLDSFVVSVEDGTGAGLISIDQDEAAAKAFLLRDFDAGPSMAGAVCVDMGRPDQRVHLTLHNISER